MQKIVDYITYGFIAVFALPTVLIMVSWNSVPGDMTYGVKRAFESAALVLARPSYDAQTSLNEQYTKRRLDEAKVILASHQSTQGLSYLSQQIAATKAMIQNAPTQEKKQEAAKKYITTLQTVSTELKAQKTKSSGTLAVKPVAKTSTAVTSGTSQQELQTQLRLQIMQVSELQQSLQSQLQNPQSQQLLAQLQQQSQQLAQLQQQVLVQGQISAPQTRVIQNQIEQQTQNVMMIQNQIEQGEEGTGVNTQQLQEQIAINSAISDAENQVDTTILQLQNIAQNLDENESVPATVQNPPNSNNGQNTSNDQEDHSTDNGGDNGNSNPQDIDQVLQNVNQGNGNSSDGD